MFSAFLFSQAKYIAAVEKLGLLVYFTFSFSANFIVGKIDT